jgi:glutamate--cysteine ligase
MMLQTASIQISLDWGPRPAFQWRVLNALTPLLVAIFANSPWYGGANTGQASFRAGVWRRLDPARTGLLAGSSDPAAEYLAFALGAPAILLPDRDGEPRPFRESLERGQVTQQHWAAHLSTLFPEVRPRGHIEVRSVDALPPQWYGAPVALLAGIAYHEPALEAAARLLGAPDAAWLERAGRSGLRDPATADIARELWQIALSGCEALGPPLVDDDLLDSAEAFRHRYTELSRSPADDWEVAPCSAPLPPQLLVTGT